jgi:hypothetical protein
MDGTISTSNQTDDQLRDGRQVPRRQTFTASAPSKACSFAFPITSNDIRSIVPGLHLDPTAHSMANRGHQFSSCILQSTRNFPRNDQKRPMPTRKSPTNMRVALFQFPFFSTVRPDRSVMPGTTPPGMPYMHISASASWKKALLQRLTSETRLRASQGGAAS